MLERGCGNLKNVVSRHHGADECDRTRHEKECTLDKTRAGGLKLGS